MQVRFISAGFGATVPSLNFGLNIVNGVYLLLREAPGSKPFVMGFSNGPGVGSGNSAMAFSHVETAWVDISPGNNPWLCSRQSLLGKTVEVCFSRALVVGGKVDLTLKVFGRNGEQVGFVSRTNVQSSGFQFSSTRFRGKLVSMAGKVQPFPARGCFK
ncbi:MAG: hypothetical protein HC848_06865 [Limnobacter sp.]|nr:hypothetical protein [Limnobacter sp.]